MSEITRNTTQDTTDMRDLAARFVEAARGTSPDTLTEPHKLEALIEAEKLSQEQIRSANNKKQHITNTVKTALGNLITDLPKAKASKEPGSQLEFEADNLPSARVLAASVIWISYRTLGPNYRPRYPEKPNNFQPFFKIGEMVEPSTRYRGDYIARLLLLPVAYEGFYMSGMLIRNAWPAIATVSGRAAESADRLALLGLTQTMDEQEARKFYPHGINEGFKVNSGCRTPNSISYRNNKQPLLKRPNRVPTKRFVLGVSDNRLDKRIAKDGLRPGVVRRVDDQEDFSKYSILQTGQRLGEMLESAEVKGFNAESFMRSLKRIDDLYNSEY